jgi:hypothetical protein
MFTLLKFDPSGADRWVDSGWQNKGKALGPRRIFVRRSIGSHFRMTCTKVKHDLCDAQCQEFIGKTMRYVDAEWVAARRPCALRRAEARWRVGIGLWRANLGRKPNMEMERYASVSVERAPSLLQQTLKAA